MKKPAKVAIICDDLMVGGWTSLVSMIQALDNKQITPLVICVFDKGPNAELLAAKGIKVHCFYFTKLNMPLKLLQLSRLLRKEKVDLIHTQLHYSHIIGLTAGILAGVSKTLINVHSIENSPQGLCGLYKKFLFTRKVSRVISVSNAARNSFIKLYPSCTPKTSVIYNCVNIKEISERLKSSEHKLEDFKIPSDAFVVMTVANLKAEKGHRYLIEAASILKDKRIHFVFIGSGGEEESLKKDIIARNLSENFHFWGSRTDVPELLKLGDIFVLPSISEGLGICLLEAFAAKLPVIASNIHGIPEIAHNAKHALLTEAGNPEELCEKIRVLKNSPEQREAMIQEAQNFIKSFDVHKITESYQNAYLETIELF